MGAGNIVNLHKLSTLKRHNAGWKPASSSLSTKLTTDEDHRKEYYSDCGPVKTPSCCRVQQNEASSSYHKARRRPENEQGLAVVVVVEEEHHYERPG